MRAVVCTKYGPPEVLQIREVERPVPKAGELLVRIHATTVTRGDALLRNLKFPLRLVFGLAFGTGKNKILGHELAGIVASTGKGVTRFQEGDAIFGSVGSRGGAHADYICVPEDLMLAGKPANLSFEEAAAVPIGGNTALHILKTGNIQPGEAVVIYGASGSVGTYAVQLAKHSGAVVTGVCSTSSLEVVRTLGVDQVIDYTQEDFTQRGQTWDVVFDAVGKLSVSQTRSALKKDGVYLSVKSPTKESVENLLFLRDLIEAGAVRPVIDRRYPLEQIVEAHRYVDTGHKKGNVVVTVVQSSRT